MWPWIKRWRDWAMNDLWPFYRISPQPQAIHYSYEKAGLTVHDQPIPWNAEAVVVDARLRLPQSARRKSDFQLRLAGRDPVPAEDMRRQDADNHYRLTFRAEPPGVTTTAEVLYRSHVLGQLTLPYLGRDEFLQGVRLQLPTLNVRLNNESVSCQTFVASQCRGLIANAVLVSPTSLVPLLDLDLAVEFRNERGGLSQTVPVQLCCSQLAARQALVTAAPRRFPRRIGSWQVTWILGDRPLAPSHRVRAISTRTFQRSLRVTDARFVLCWPKGNVTAARQVPPNEKPARVGPCFYVSSREPGMAGVCQLQVRAQVPGSVQPPLLMEAESLIKDGPTKFAPGTLDVADIAQITAFELSLKGQQLGVLSLCPAPTASFTSEGGFKPPHDYAWSAAAEDELTDRLNRLLEGGS